MRILENLEPKKVFKYFEDICNIPHGSTNLDGISSYLEKFAEDRNLFHVRDESNNIIIVKEATLGYEDVEPIMLQGHMDMVAVKKADCDIDMTKDPLRLKVDGDFVYAEGTSLGGDDGIAVAYILAILDSQDIAHPRLEAVITTDEEIGMEGATAIDLSMLKSKRMLNIDSEEEGILLTSCAGGARVDCVLPIKRENVGGINYEISVFGLLGGHSGTEINKERGNAIKLLGRILYEVLEVVPINLLQMQGGEKDNAIPREANATIVLPQESEDIFIRTLDKVCLKIRNEYKTKEKDIKIEWKKCESSDLSLDAESTRRIAEFLMLLPNGVMSMSADIAGLVETSLNVGILSLAEEEFVTSSAVRSSIESAKQNIVRQLSILSKNMQGTVKIYGEYPGWQFNPDSKLRATMVRIYKEMFKEDVKVEALHAGLECGIMISKIPGLDCVSFGPNIYDIHTTEEKLSIASTTRMWEYLLRILSTK